MSVAALFLQSSITRFKIYKDLADRSFEQLKPEEMHFRPGTESNSIAQVIQHISGNMISRWTDFLISDGEKPWRERDKEFEMGSQSQEELIALWERGWSSLFNTLQSLTDADLEKTITIRQEPLTVIDAINRQLAHYPYHVGQIVYLAKWIRNKDWKSLSIPKRQSDQYNQSLDR